MAFECLEVAHEALLALGPVVRAVARADRNLGDQLRRAATSVVSNIDEGAGHVGRARTHHYRLAMGSARETMTQVRVAVAWGYVDHATVAPVLALLDRVRAMLWRLTH